MTTEDLKELLESVSNSMKTLNDVFTTPISTQLVNLLTALNDPTVLPVIAPVIQLANSELTQDKLSEHFTNAVRTTKILNKMVVTGETDKIANMCHSIEQRSLVMAVVAKIL